MKALVLSCDRYRVFADHMIRSYDRHWPDHPFRFVVPYQELATPDLGAARSPVDLVHSAEPIRDTLRTLLADVDDDEWVYWCIDDKYLIELDVDVARAVAAWVPTIQDPSVAGISFARARTLLRPTHVDVDDRLQLPSGQPFVRRRDLSQIWLHQFVRGAVLRSLLDVVPPGDVQAKTLDQAKSRVRLPDDRRLYVMERNAVVFGESTTRGVVTANCRDSMHSLGMVVPSGFGEATAHKVIGTMGQGTRRSRPWWRQPSRFDEAR